MYLVLISTFILFVTYLFLDDDGDGDDRKNGENRECDEGRMYFVML